MPTINCGPNHGGPSTEHGKAIASRNATTHGLFARDIVLPSLGEDPEGYRQVQDEWTQQLAPRNLLEQHYVEKIAAASWRLRRLHRWQAQIFEDTALTEDERLDRLDKVLRHATALQRQIDTAVKLLAKDVPQLYTRRLRDQVLEDLHVTERECRDEPETDLTVSLETSNRLYRLRKATNQAVNELSVAPLDPVVEATIPNLPARRAVGVCAPRPAVHGGDLHGGDLHGGDLHGGDLHGGLNPKFTKTNPRPTCPRFLPPTLPASGGVARNEPG